MYDGSDTSGLSLFIFKFEIIQWSGPSDTPMCVSVYLSCYNFNDVLDVSLSMVSSQSWVMTKVGFSYSVYLRFRTIYSLFFTGA